MGPISDMALTLLREHMEYTTGDRTHGPCGARGGGFTLEPRSSSWFSYDSVRIGQGRENAKKFLTENTEMCPKLEAAIRGRTDEVAEEMMTGPDADED